MAGYTREFLLDAFMHRYQGVEIKYDLRELAAKAYDNLGKDNFRKYASLDADAIREYKQALKNV